MEFTITKPLSIFFSFLTGYLLTIPAAGWSLQDQKKTDFKMVVQNQNSRWVRSVAFSPDGKYIASGSLDTTIKLWNHEGTLLKTLEGHSGDVDCVAFSPDGKLIVSASADKTIKLWGMDGGLIRTFNGHSETVWHVSFSHDGRHIVSGAYDGTIKLWDLEGNLIRTIAGHSDCVAAVVFSPDDKYLLSGSLDRTIKLWDADGKLVRTFEGHSGMVYSVAFSSDGKYIVSGADDATVKLWSIEGALIRTFTGHSGRVWIAAFSPDGSRIVSGASDKTLRFWSPDGRLVRVIERDSDIISAAFSPNGKYLVYGLGNGTVNLWYMDKDVPGAFGGHSGWTTTVAFSPDGRHIVSGTDDGALKLWTMGGDLIRTFEGHSGGIASVAFSPDCRHIVSTSGDKTIKLWGADGGLIRTFNSHSNTVWRVSFDPYGKYIISSSGDISSGNTSSGDNAIRLWNLEGKLIRTLSGHSSFVESAVFSPDGKHIASGSFDNTVKLWKADGKPLKTFTGHGGGVTDVAFSPDGDHVLSTSMDRTMRLWDLDGNLLRKFTGHSSMVKSAAFSPDGKYIVSGSWDETIKLWSVDGAIVRTFPTFPSHISNVVFSPDGKHVAASCGDGTIKLLDIDTGNYSSLISDSDNWVIYTPDGYFDASPHGGELVAMVKGLEAFGVDQFAVRNNRPDLILERMGLGTPEEITHYNLLFQKRLKKLGLTEADLSAELHAPEAKITGTKQDGKFIDVAFSFSDTKYPLKRYNIYVNDVPLFGSSGKEISGKSFNGTEKIELTTGKNKIELSAMNNAGAESFRALTYADYDGKEKGTLYYLAFGASKYKDSTINLNYADKDMKDLGAVLSKMRPAYSDIHVKTFLNNEVTPENIKKAKDFLKDAKTDDTVILAIAGHGGYSKGSDPKYYYVAYETDVSKLAGTGVDFDFIEDLLDDIRPRKKLFLMDTCESGELDENIYDNYFTLADARGMKPRTYRKPMKARGGGSKGRGYLYEKDRFIYNDLSRRTGAVVFSSSKGGEISYESSTIQNGFFTKEIINALTSKAADKNNDGRIDSAELRDFVSGAVAGATGGLQHPVIDRDNLYQKIDLPLITESRP